MVLFLSHTQRTRGGKFLPVVRCIRTRLLIFLQADVSWYNAYMNQPGGMFDPRSRGPRFILYIFVYLLLIVFVPALNEITPLVIVSMLVCGPLILVLAYKGLPYRSSFTGIAKMALESAPIFGLGVTLLGIVRLLALIFGWELGT